MRNLLYLSKLSILGGQKAYKVLAPDRYWLTGVNKTEI